MKRIAALDVLRGFALIGIIFVNIYQMNSLANPNGLDSRILQLLSATVTQRFFTIFSFLFGIGFHLFLSRAEERGYHPRRLFLRRLFILFVFGLIHRYFQPGEALMIYAVIGLLLIPFYRAKIWIILAAGLFLTAGGCYTGFYPLLILGMFLMGLWAGRIGLFTHTERYVRGLRAVQIVALLLIVPFYIYQQDFFNRTGMIDVAIARGSLPLSVFYVTTLTLLMQRKAVQRILMPLGNLGRMALTNYLMQTLFILSLAGLLEWKEDVHMPELIIAAALILAFQILFSTLWLRYFRMGPIEYIWRLGTYGRAGAKISFRLAEGERANAKTSLI